MLFRETIAVCCENHTEHSYCVVRMQSISVFSWVIHKITIVLQIVKNSLHTSQKTLRLHYKDLWLNAVWRNSRCLFLKQSETYKYTVLAKWKGFLKLKLAVYIY
jgi:hypothetical protein